MKPKYTKANFNKLLKSVRIWNDWMGVTRQKWDQEWYPEERQLSDVYADIIMPNSPKTFAEAFKKEGWIK